MGQRETPGEIDDAAACWAARIDRAPLTREEDAALEQWLAPDPRRIGALARAQAVLIRFDRVKALGSDFTAEGFLPEIADADGREAPPALARRRALAGAGALAASVAAGAVGLGVWNAAPRFATRRGEIRLVPLADGSVVTLNTASEIAVRFDPAHRRVRIIEGEALFDVTKDSRRPFVVDAGDVRVRVVGTSFTVRKLPGRATEVLVREGVVEVTRHEPASPSVEPVRLVANQRGVAEPAADLVPRSLRPTEVARQLAWREGMIAFEDTTLAAAAADFARYSRTRILIADPAVAETTVTGLFSANNPAGFAKSVALSLNLRAQPDGDDIRLMR